MTVHISLGLPDSPGKNLLLPIVQGFLCLVGILCLGFYSYVQLDTNVYQFYQNRQFEQALKNNEGAGTHEAPVASHTVLLSPESPSRENAVAATARASIGLPLGKLEIRRIGLAAMIMEGTDAQTLQRAVGHVPETVLPGQVGNIAIAGHRDTFFRGLRNVQKGDSITLTTLNGSSRYLVDFSEVVSPDDIDVLKPSSDAILTLITCYPFSYIGSAPERLIVRAHRVAE